MCMMRKFLTTVSCSDQAILLFCASQVATIIAEVLQDLEDNLGDVAGLDFHALADMSSQVGTCAALFAEQFTCSNSAVFDPHQRH